MKVRVLIFPGNIFQLILPKEYIANNPNTNILNTLIKTLFNPNEASNSVKPKKVGSRKMGKIIR
jgi:hypothetical protein